MENFVLYEELGKSDHSIIYKGRRKGTITFVAIHCIEKCKRPEVTNTVRMTHDACHPNVVRFHEWYETSNHLWLVVELCTGGSLDKLIQQDGHLPESAIRSFGVNLVSGLHYIHTQGIVFNDLQPAKILLDTPGILKYGDFGLSKVEGENLSELFHKFADAGEQWNPENMDEVYANIRTAGSLTYMAPEVVQGGEPTVLSDLWSLGCVFYEMFTGHPPFLAESEEQLKEKILTKDFQPPKVRGTRFSSKASPDFLSLLEGLLNKDSVHRLGWPGLVSHPFWLGQLAELAKDFEATQELRTSMATSRSSVFEHGGSSALGRIKGVDTRRSMERPMSHLEMIDSARPGTAMSDVLRPKTAPGMESCGGLFTLSARPHTAVPPDDKVTTPAQTVRGPVTTREEIEAIRQPIGSEQDSMSTDRSSAEKPKLIFHPSDFIVTPIVDNSKIQKTAPPKYEPKTLPVPPFSVEKLLSLSDAEQEKQVRQVLDTMAAGEKGPPSQKRIHLLNYAAAISASPPIADRFLAVNGLAIMSKQIKDTSHVDIRVKLGRVMALVANNCSHLDDNVQVTEPLMTLTEIVREGVKNSKLKQGLFPALGEILYMVALQEKKQGRTSDSWTVPSMTYTVISKYCRDAEDAVVNHIAAKIVENVTTVQGPHAQKFLSNELAQSLWYLFKHSTMDALRCTALSALCHLTWLSPPVFQSVVDTVGLTTVLGALSLGISRVQQTIVTMFGILVQAGGHLTRLVQDKDFLQKIMRLLESPSMVIRGKAFCVLHDVFSASLDMLIPCQARLVMYIERDSRRQTPREGREAEENAEYLAQCLEYLVSFICQSVPVIYRDILSALESAAGRKHPSAVQVRQLKSSLPLLAILPHLVTSQVFRSRVVTEEFVRDLGILLSHVGHVEAGNTNIESVAEKIKGTFF